MPKRLRYSYLAHSHMGRGYTYDSPCWMVLAFTNLQERSDYAKEFEYNPSTGNYEIDYIDRKTAEKIAPELRKKLPGKAARTILMSYHPESKSWNGITQ